MRSDRLCCLLSTSSRVPLIVSFSCSSANSSTSSSTTTRGAPAAGVSSSHPCPWLLFFLWRPLVRGAPGSPSPSGSSPGDNKSTWGLL